MIRAGGTMIARDGIEAQRGLNDTWPGDIVPDNRVLMTLEEASSYCSRSASALRNYIKRGDFPQPARKNGRANLYYEEDIHRFAREVLRWR